MPGSAAVERRSANPSVSTAFPWPHVSIAPRRQLASSTEMAARTDRGRKRADNQDTFIIDRRLGLAVVCDGMGGRAAGSRASTLAARLFRETLAAARPLLRSYLEGQSPEPVGKRDILDLLQAAANAASAGVLADAVLHSQCAGMGTTLVSVLMLDNHAFITNVGDSRAYLLRNGALEQLTRDHTVYDELLRSGCFPADSRPRAGLRNILTHAVGISDHCHADTFVIDVAPGDRILLCSDGLHQYFDSPDGAPDDLRRELLEANGQVVADTLLDIANARGGSDNITAVVLTIGAVGGYATDELEAIAARRAAISGSALLSGLDGRESASVLALAEVQAFAPGEAVTSADTMGGDVFVLLRGAVTFDDPDAGRVELQGGRHLTEMFMLSGGTGSLAAVATQPTELLTLSRRALFALFRSDPELAEKVLRQLEPAVASAPFPLPSRKPAPERRGAADDSATTGPF